MQNTSKKYSWNLIDLHKIGRFAVITFLSGCIAFVSQLVTQIDFGVHAYWIMPLLGVLIETGRRFVTDYSKVDTVK